MADKFPMQADGGDKDVAKDSDRTIGSTGAGESGGGAYANPRDPADPKPKGGGFMGHGGQTDIDYHGPGQLGDETVDPEKDDNSATRND